MDYYKMSPARLYKELGVNEAIGVSEQTRTDYLKTHGYNRLPATKTPGFLPRFLGQFRDYMIIILLVCALISAYVSYRTGENNYTEPFIILAIVILNAMLGTFQELKAAKALEALKSCQSRRSLVLTNGRISTINSEELIPGDIIKLKSGDIVPADSRIITCNYLQVNEACLTGESKNITKSNQIINRNNLKLFEQNNMLFSGSTIETGDCLAIVVLTGAETEVGRIASMIGKEVPPPSPLLLRIKRLSTYLGTMCLIICFSIFLLGIINHQNLITMFLTSLSLAVAAIPEGLPAATTIMLSIGVTRLAGQRAIMKNLSGVETLGKISVICTDKTGTITKGKMSVFSYYDGNSLLTVDSNNNQNHQYKSLLTKALLAANENSYNETDKAILNAYTNSFGPPSKQPKAVKTLPFDSSRKYMYNLYNDSNGTDQSSTLYIKGALDKLIDFWDTTPDQKVRLLDCNKEACDKGLRVIAIAHKKIDSGGNISLDGLIIDGFLAIIDPPRPEVAAQVARARNAGIETIMITGDHPDTARAIGAMVGIPESKIYARVTPEDKLKIVKDLQAKGQRVLMCGDGINDAPALKVADIGAAMGISGTEVAKESADMILTDDNYATIVSAIAGGRGIYENIKKSLHFLLSCNMGEIFTVLIAIIIGYGSPLSATQLLAINLITDSLPAIALGMEINNQDVMRRSWLGENTATFTPLRVFQIVFEGLLIAGLSTLGFMCYGETGCFVVLGLTELLHAINLRDDSSILKRHNVSKYLAGSIVICLAAMGALLFIPCLQTAFSLATLTAKKIAILAATSCSIIIVKEIEKKLL